MSVKVEMDVVGVNCCFYVGYCYGGCLISV